jgi:hypothetical protein
MSFLCWIHHKWEKRPSEDGSYGMGLTTFEMQQCGRCHRWRDRVKDYRSDGHTRYPWHYTERPAIERVRKPEKVPSQ